MQVRDDVEVKQVMIPGGEETYILCRTAGRKEKEEAIRKRFSDRMEQALKRLAHSIATGRLKDRNKRERRLGRIPELLTYPSHEMSGFRWWEMEPPRKRGWAAHQEMPAQSVAACGRRSAS